jgi:hypothetical protein
VSVFEIGWWVFFTAMCTVVIWDLWDLRRETRQYKCCCGQFQIPVSFDQVHDRTDHVTHTAERCQPCREAL